jgi:hypothetical protein
METVKKLAVVFLLIFSVAGCKKDKRDFLFPIKPHDFLSAAKYEKLTLDIVYVEGYQPTEQSVANLEDFLGKRLNKPGGINVVYKSIPATGKSYFTIDDLRDIEKKNRSDYSKHNTLVTFIFFGDAPYSDGNVLGIAYGNSSMGIFEKTINNYSGGIAQPSRTVLETIVEEHEFGHLMGLVDNGTDMVTNHVANGKHCNNQDCLMYYATETTDLTANITGGNIPELDANCIADLRKNGGK